LLVALEGVIDIDNPVMSVNDVLVVENVSVLVVLNTCNTVPGVLFESSVPVTAGSVDVKLLALLGEAMVNTPAPDALPESAIELMCSP
jgi:hypothetical protein